MLVPTVTFSETLPRLDLKIQLDGSVDKFLKEAPVLLKGREDPDPSSKSFMLHYVDPHIAYQGKEIIIRDAPTVFLSYHCGRVREIWINNFNDPETTIQLKERLKILLPAIDAFGFKRKKGYERFSVEDLPLPIMYQAKNGAGIIWENNDGQEILKLSITVPEDPQKYYEKKYHLSFMYFNFFDFEQKNGRLNCPVIKD